MSSFADFVAVFLVQQNSQKTKLFKVSFLKVSQVAEFDDEFCFSGGILINFKDQYVLPHKSYEVKSGLKQLQTEP